MQSAQAQLQSWRHLFLRSTIWIKETQSPLFHMTLLGLHSALIWFIVRQTLRMEFTFYLSTHLYQPRLQIIWPMEMPGHSMGFYPPITIYGFIGKMGLTLNMQW